MANWHPSEWGSSDEIGALNRITSTTILNAFRLAKKGKVYTLGRVLENEIPVPSFHGQYFCNTQYSHSTGYDWHVKHLGEYDNGYTAMNMRLCLCDNTGTHIDNLNHVGIKEGDDFRLYNGFLSGEITTSFGTTKLGIEKVPPIISRGVVVDLAGYRGVDMLKGGQVITVEDIEGALKKQGTSIREGDAFLIHTGWGKLWMKGDDILAAGEPGLGKAAGQWLTERKIILAGIDNCCLDAFPFETPREALPVHLILLTKNGIRIIENMFLEEIVNDRVFEFLFICLPLKIRGAAGSPVTPIAIV